MIQRFSNTAGKPQRLSVDGKNWGVVPPGKAALVEVTEGTTPVIVWTDVNAEHHGKPEWAGKDQAPGKHKHENDKSE
jgi:hypothetical protein